MVEICISFRSPPFPESRGPFAASAGPLVRFSNYLSVCLVGELGQIQPADEVLSKGHERAWPCFYTS